MSTITIKSCRNDTEKLSFEWPDRQPDTKGEFVGLVTCDVVNPRFPKIAADQVLWAVDSALSYANNDGSDIEDVANLISLKDWLNYAQLEINAPDDEEQLAKDNEIARLKARIDELEGITLTMKAQAAEVAEPKPDTMIIPEREFKFERSRHVVARHHAKHPAQPFDKEQEIRTARTERSKVCTIL